MTIKDLVFDSVLRTLRHRLTRMDRVDAESSPVLVSNVMGALLAAAYMARNETSPPDLGHVIIFSSVGELTRQRLHELGRPGYEPYAGRLGLYARSLAWTVYRQALAKHCQPYLEGTIDRTTALQSLVDELG